MSALLAAALTMTAPAGAQDLKVMKMGLGSGTVTSNPPGINCGGDCDETYGANTPVTLTAVSDPGSTFSRWDGDGAGTSNPTTVTMDQARSVRAVFEPNAAIPEISDFRPEGIQDYLNTNTAVNTPARFLKALPPEFKKNWILMSRSESLQTGTAQSPRLLLPSADARHVFTVGMTQHSSYPGSHPNAIEFMQWDPTDKNFRFHEIVLDTIPAMGVFASRSRGVSIDDSKCSKCHSTRNVLNRSPFPGTTGDPIGLVKTKNKPNWDSYDSWGGMLPFNRDRIYKGSVEAAAFRKLLNFWTWRSNDSVRAIIEQLELQPAGVPTAHLITRTNGGANDGHINFPFDSSPPVFTEPPPSSSGTGAEAPINTAYSFDGVTGTGTPTSVVRGGSFITLHHSNIATSDEGRGVRFFDALGGLAGNLNPQRIADELINHRYATGSVPVDIRPIALAITRGLLRISSATNTVEATTTSTPLAVNLTFFDSRNGMRINELVADTEARARSLTRRKADIQKKNLDRAEDLYLLSPTGGDAIGLIQIFGAATTEGTSTAMQRLRQDVFRRPTSGFPADGTVMGGIYVDREDYSFNTRRVALYRYFLEPLGVSVDKWSMCVRGRSRTYTFADVFGTYINEFSGALRDSLLAEPITGLTNPDNDDQLIAAVNSTMGALPAVDEVPTFTDIQRIFNKSCIECHGGLSYPPYQNFGSFVDFSEDENPPTTTPVLPNPRLARSYQRALAFTTENPLTSRLFDRITRPSEECRLASVELMPCGGPALSKTDVETIRRWIVGPPSRPSTVGDPHIKTVNGINYDFQATGEFILLRDEYLEIQARQTAVQTDRPLGPDSHTGLTSCVSINTAVAVRVGESRITYEPNLSGKPDPDGLQLRIDGKLAKIGERPIPLPSGNRIVHTSVRGGIQIESPGGIVIVITPGWWDHYQVWYLNVDVRGSRATMGVMGAIASGNWLPALPDGTRLGPRPAGLHARYDVLYQKFANAWRVTDKNSLFDYAPGTATKNFTVEKWPNGESSNSCPVPPQIGGPIYKPPQKPLPRQTAEKCCNGIMDKDRREHCIHDVMATGECGFGKTYLEEDQIVRNTAPHPPVLVFPKDNAIGLDTPIKFTWTNTTDKDGDPITYRYYVWPIDQAPNNNDAESVSKADYKAESKLVTQSFSKLEKGKAYYWKVIAEDGKGGVVESATSRFELK